LSDAAAAMGEGDEIRRDLALFYAYRIVSRLYFHLPVLFLHLFIVEMGLARIIALLAVYGLTTTVTANLGGALQPHLRLKEMVALGELMKGAGLALVILGTSVGGTDFWIVMAGQVVGGTGFSLAISSDGGLLRAVTAASGNDLFARTQSRSQSLMFAATLVAGCVGSILYAYEAHWPFYAALAATLAAGAAILFVREEKVRPAPPAAAGAGGTDDLGLDAGQRFWMNFYALSRAYTLGPFVGFLPFYFIELQVDEFLFGSVLGLFSMAAFVAAWYANAFLQRFGLRALMAVTVCSMLGAMLLFASCDWLAVQGFDYFLTGLVAVTLLGVGSGGVRPATMGNIDLGRLRPAHRTVVLSRMERNFGIVNGAMLFAGGSLLARSGFPTLMLVLGLSYVVAMGLLMVSRKTA
jgi:predicted MFS family arabinose efflux permease